MAEDNTELDPKKRANAIVGRLTKGPALLGMVGIIALIAGFGGNIEKISSWVTGAMDKIDRREMPSNPRVIMVSPTQPDGHFGVLHKMGLNQGLAPTALGSANVIGGHAKDFKFGKMAAQLAKLETELKKGDVIAVVAPSITEATPEVLDLVARIEPSIPVFIESSIPWEQLHLYRDKPPMFRLSSGIGERGREIGGMTDKLVSSGLAVWLFVEDVPGKRSYGTLLQDHVLRTDGGKLIPPHRRIHYPAGNPESKTLALPIDDPNAVIFVLGLGRDFQKIVEHEYRLDSGNQARLVGVMNAHILEDLLKNGGFLTNRIFDISDLDTRPGMDRDRAAQTFYNSYAQEWGRVLPTQRDQAFSFDVAVLLSKAFTEDIYGEKYVVGLQKFTSNLSALKVTGVTGQITFSNPRSDFERAWQNDQPRLQVVNYSPDNKDKSGWAAVEWSSWDAVKENPRDK